MQVSVLGFRTVLLLAAATLLAAQNAVSDAQQRSRRRLHGDVQTSTRRPRGLGPDDPWCWLFTALCVMPACLLAHFLSAAQSRTVHCHQQLGPWCYHKAQLGPPAVSDVRGACCRIEHLSWRPRAWLYHNFMTAEECDHIMELAAPSMARSTVVDADTGNSVLDPIRTSQGTFLS